MGVVKKIAESHNIQSLEGFSAAMKQMKSVSEGELRYQLTFDERDQGSSIEKYMCVLAKAELERRSFQQNRNVTLLVGTIGALAAIAGTVLGAILTATVGG